MPCSFRRNVVYIARKFENTGVALEDLISIGTIGLIKAVETFKADKKIRLAISATVRIRSVRQWTSHTTLR